MKILYIGYYKENSDWGRYATNNILALEKAGLDVVCRAISFSGKETPREISHLEDKSLDDCDICIQHVFPEHLVGTDKFKKNIAILGNDFIEMEHTTWVEQLNQMDQIWVPSICASEQIAEELSKKTKIVHNCFPIDPYTKKYQDIDIPEISGRYKFYTHVDSDAKEIETILTCFYSEFDKSDNVALIIQITGSADKDSIDNAINSVKQKVCKQQDQSDCPPEIIVPYSKDRRLMYAIHQYADCFISPSIQRSLPLNVFDAMCFGNTPIVLDLTDSTEYLAEDWHVNAVYKTIDNKSSIWKDVYNSNNYVLQPCEMDMRMRMNRKYQDWIKNPMIKTKKKKEAMEKAKKFSLDSFAKTVKEIFNA